jgi:hypothetical protein
VSDKKDPFEEMFGESPIASAMPTQEEMDRASAKAEQEFAREVITRAFAGVFTNRFHIQIEPGGNGAAIFGVGSTGLVAAAQIGEALTVQPVAIVHNVYRVDTVFLRSLVDTINTLLPPEIKTDGEASA